MVLLVFDVEYDNNGANEKAALSSGRVGGVGMSALAQALLARGATVSGSDRFLDQVERWACCRNWKPPGSASSIRTVRA
jgi:hypothetical protein